MTEKRFLFSLHLPDTVEEITFIEHQKHTCYNGMYPFKIFSDKELYSVDFAPITIFCGGNGSGKTTLLNILAEITGITRHSAFNNSPFFADYCHMCQLHAAKIPHHSSILTSDDVSDYLLNQRMLNEKIDLRRRELFAEYMERKQQIANPFRSMADYDDWLETNAAKTQTKSQYVKKRMIENADMFSNGETAMRYYVERIDKDALYLIDEPENSLSPAFQLELAEFLSASAKYCGCQFVIATHSPLLLSLPGARLYDLDACPVCVTQWTKLDSVWEYYRFFKQHEDSILNDNTGRTAAP